MPDKIRITRQLVRFRISILMCGLMLVICPQAAVRPQKSDSLRPLAHSTGRGATVIQARLRARKIDFTKRLIAVDDYLFEVPPNEFRKARRCLARDARRSKEFFLVPTLRNRYIAVFGGDPAN